MSVVDDLRCETCGKPTTSGATDIKSFMGVVIDKAGNRWPIYGEWKFHPLCSEHRRAGIREEPTVPADEATVLRDDRQQ